MSVDICSLDYLIGTLATAYKGVITSLAVKDFCITRDNGSIILKGSVMSMPAGDYSACLIREGAELARAGLREGFFELKMDGSTLDEARNLQIDIIQNGRHIGTFLLKRERREDYFVSAVELSEELKGINFKGLVSLLGGRVGLLKSGETIITKILSPKKNWNRFSTEIYSFSKDLFWMDANAYQAWFGILIRYSLKASEKAEPSISNKPLSNFLSMIELPLEQEENTERLKKLVYVWLSALKEGKPELSYSFRQTLKAAQDILDRFPDSDISPVLTALVESLRSRLSKASLIDRPLFYALRGLVPADGLSSLFEFSEDRKYLLTRKLDDVETALKKRDFDESLRLLSETGASIFDEAEMVDELFGNIGRNISAERADNVPTIMSKVFRLMGGLSFDAYKQAVVHIAGLLEKLTRLEMIDACMELLRHIASAGDTGEDMILNLDFARVVHASGNDRIWEGYGELLKGVLIPAPNVAGFSNETWAELVEPRHLARLSRFLAIISLDPVRFRGILLHVICNLFVAGVFIPDDSLFQREVSAYLNSEGFGRAYLLNYILLKRLPVYFNDVGATGRVRDYTTEIDSWGNDQVLYFLRKQVHVNASNYNVELAGRIISSWVYDQPEILGGVVPDDVIQRTDRRLFSGYSSVMKDVFCNLNVFDEEGLHLERIIELPERSLTESGERHINNEAGRKVLLLINIYREISKKYSAVSGHFEAPDMYRAFAESVDTAVELRKTVVSAEKTAAAESLYFKRHIAFGIPSVMGTYHEPKFDAMSGIFRNEEKARVLLENIISNIGEERETDANDLGNYLSCLGPMNGLLAAHDLANFQVNELLAVFENNPLYASQISDLLRVWQKEVSWMVESLTDTFDEPLSHVLHIFPQNELPPRLSDIGKEDVSAAEDIVMREILSSINGFLEMDRFLTSLLALPALNYAAGDDYRINEELKGRDEDFFVLDELSPEDAMRLAPLLGGKAKNLIYLIRHNMPVPPGVVFRSDRTPDYREYTSGSPFGRLLEKAVRKIEERAGSLFGDTKDPLFLSVRSGSYISMPGILSSVLYCGMNRETVRALIERTGNARFGWDSYRRFIEHYGSVVLGVDLKIFDNISSGLMKVKGIEDRDELEAEHLEQLTLLYLADLGDRGLHIPEDVFEQLRESIAAVYASWYSKKALDFRRALNVSEQWGTSVMLMQMVSGNRKGSGASVFFTRNPVTAERKIFGDTRELATGDDLVSGRFRNRPLSNEQASGGTRSLEAADNDLFMLHQKLGEEIEKAMGGLPQEVEATYTTRPGGERTVYVLQTRRMEYHRGFTKRFDDVCRLQLETIGRGAGAHGGALSGIATFATSRDSIRGLKKDSGRAVILLRKAASTSDISLMPVIDGILTSTGGVASHASVLAQKFDVTAVVGCPDIEIREDNNGEPYAVLRGSTIREGDAISIDGSTGLVYSGLCFERRK